MSKSNGSKTGILDWTGKNGFIMLALCVILPFCLSNPLGFVFFYVGGIPFTVWAIIRYRRQVADNSVLRQTAETEVIPRLLNEAFENVDYRPWETIPLSRVLETSIFPKKEAEYIRGSDHFRASFQGTPVSFCNATVYYLEQVPIEDEPVHRTRDVTHVTFQGLYLILETGIHPRSPITVLAKAGSSYRLTKPVETGNPDFDRQFQVSGDPMEVSALLNLYRIQQILAAHEAAGCNMTLRFLPDGQVGIALKNKKLLFQVTGSDVQSSDVEQQFRSEIAWITGILKSLNLK